MEDSLITLRIYLPNVEAMWNETFPLPPILIKPIYDDNCSILKESAVTYRYYIQLHRLDLSHRVYPLISQTPLSPLHSFDLTNISLTFSHFLNAIQGGSGKAFPCSPEVVGIACNFCATAIMEESTGWYVVTNGTLLSLPVSFCLSLQLTRTSLSKHRALSTCCGIKGLLIPHSLYTVPLFPLTYLVI